MKCAHCGKEINKEELWGKLVGFRGYRKGKYLCRSCTFEMEELNDVPVFLVLLLLSVFLLGSSLSSFISLVFGIGVLCFTIIFGLMSTVRSKLKTWSRQMNEFYEAKK